MLRRLEIENYGLIARAEIAFAPGATIFTGETGSGKTMLLGALGFALGARAGADVLRRGAARARVTLSFDAGDAARARMAAAGFDLDPGEDATLSREMTDAGRSSLRLNGRPATAAQIREFADGIAEVVGQHEAQRLLSPAYHLDLLDRYAGAPAAAARAAVASAYARTAELTAELERLHGDDLDARTRYDDARYAAREIDEARIEAGEDERLAERRRYLDNVERIATALRRAGDALAADETGVTHGLGQAIAALGGIAEIGAEFEAMHAQASALQSEANDAAATVARALESAEFDPAELESINARLELIDGLKRKYGGSLASIEEAAARARAVVDAYEGRDRRTAELAAAVAAAARDLGKAALELSKLRKAAAAKLSQAVVAEFADLALASARFDIAFEALDRIGPSGAERVEVVFAANAGEAPRPLARVASGESFRAYCSRSWSPSPRRAIPTAPWSSTKLTPASAVRRPPRSALASAGLRRRAKSSA